jgi:hypothetical protein
MGNCQGRQNIFVKDTENNTYDGLWWCSRDECCICMDKPCSVLLLPCNHFIVCEDCMKHIDICPICNTNIYSYNFLKITSVLK